MQNILLTNYARNTSHIDRVRALHNGQISADSFESIALLSELILYARFGYAVSPNWLDTPMLQVWHYQAVKLLMLTVSPCNRALWAF